MDSLDLLDVIKKIESYMLNIDPEIIVTHHHGDLNIDHKIISKAVLTACRPHPGSNLKRILSFEVPSATGWDVLSTDNTLLQTGMRIFLLCLI